MNPGQKLARAREYARPAMNQADLAKALRVSRSTVASWESIGHIPHKRLLEIAGLLRIPVEWFADGLDTVPPKQLYSEGSPAPILQIREPSFERKIQVARTGFRMIPIYGSVPAGTPANSWNDAIDYEEVPDWGGNFERWGRALYGDSMEEEFLSGDIVIFESRGANENNGVYATKEGEDTFKVLHRKSLVPLNPKHESFPADGWNILGVAVMRIRFGAGGIKDVRTYPRGFIANPNQLNHSE